METEMEEKKKKDLKNAPSPLPELV